MISSPLFIKVAESMVIFGPIDQVGWRRAWSGVTDDRSAGPSRNGPPDAVRTSEATRFSGSPTRHCQIAECSESIGRSQASGLAIASAGSVAATAAAVAAPPARPEPAAEPPQPAATPEPAGDGDGARKKGLFGRLLGE